MSLGYSKLIYNSQIDGLTLTSAARASCLPATLKSLESNYFDQLGMTLFGKILGRISCAVTTPGTARFDIALGGTAIFDSLAIPLNIVAQTTVPFEFEFMLTLRAIGAAANFMGWGRFASRALVGSPAAGSGGGGVEQLPYNTVPAVGGNFNSAIANVLDCYFTQTVATGSLTVHQAVIEAHRWE